MGATMAGRRARRQKAIKKDREAAKQAALAPSAPIEETKSPSESKKHYSHKNKGK